MPTLQAFIKDIIEQPEDLGNAIALNWQFSYLTKLAIIFVLAIAVQFKISFPTGSLSSGISTLRKVQNSSENSKIKMSPDLMIHSI